ncbi:outer membrane beta-barrel protein [Mucilaginibacter sp.]|uniref:outer membrane beta-barrel protein n=1 Tax=Mucilaginibacter sp. TaxID=1882438 RepID=UPI002615A036|nr:outer membrane beta-barrel protein [Mucilaginibacter sp.]MDB4920149.1 TonB-dependent receptor [Mucilaginibacter sp.]
MKKLLLLAFCWYLSATVMAQSAPQTLTVKGITIDSVSNKPLGYVTVVLLDAKTQQAVKSGLTKNDGTFEFKNLALKEYQITFASVGYKSKTIKITGTGTEVNAGNVLLSAASNQLKEVSITAVRPIMKQEVDRISYDVQADPESKAITALDMMRKVPLLSVDADDNIKLKGSGNYKILINGKESALMAKNPSDVLRAMPATNIEKIEVITTPPAKYDAEGLSGIINIITKKNADKGYNANINGRYNSIWGPGINISANAKQGKLGVTLFFGVNKRNTNESSSGNSQLFTNGGSITQSGANTRKGNNRYGNFELSYEIDSLNLLTGSIEFFKGNNQQNSSQFTNNLNANGSVVQQYSQLSNGYNNWQGLDAAINYQLGFKQKKERLLTISYKYSYSPNSQYNNEAFADLVNIYHSQQPDFNQYNNAGGKEHTVQVDYAEPFKVVTLEIGGKAILRNNFSNFNRSDRDSATNQYIQNSVYTDNFNYHQDVYSFYNSYQVKLDKYTAKAGLRIEHTSIDADFSSVNAKVNQNYNNLIPSISIQRSFKTSSINFGFTQRIQRPGIYQLNPFVDNSNPQFISTGNPNLQPELNNTFEFTYSNFSKNSFNAGLSYAFSNNSIQNISNLRIDKNPDNTVDTITTTTYQNLGNNRSLGLNLNTNLSITKRITLNLNSEISYIWLKGSYAGQYYTNSGFRGEAFGSLGYKFDGGYRFGFNAGFFSGDVNLQGKSSNFIFNSYVLTKEFLNKKATISLVTNNPYSKYRKFTSTTTTPQFTQSSFFENPYRNYAIRFSYRFGKLNSEIKKNQRGIKNDDTKGGGGNNTSGGGS